MKQLKKISVFVLAMTLAFSLSACGSPSPSDCADSFLSAVKTQDKEKLAEVYAGESFDIIEDQEADMPASVQKLLISKLFDFDYEISDEKIDGENATVQVTLKTYHLGDSISAFLSEYISQGLALSLSGASEEKLNDLAETLFTEQLEKQKEKNFEKTVTLSLTKKDDAWQVNQIEEGSEFFDAITGGVISSIEELEDSFGNFLE